MRVVGPERVPDAGAGHPGAGAPRWTTNPIPDSRGVVLRAEDDLATQWAPGDRFHDVFDDRCRRLGRRRSRRAVAVDYGDYSYTYAELAALGNQLARLLSGLGMGVGSRVAVLLDRSIQSHAIVLAASKVGAAYVPLDPTFPADRVRFITEDSDVDLVLTLERFTDAFAQSDVRLVALDAVNHEIAKLGTGQFEGPGVREQADALAYIIYTSGTTGRPKGVPINHSSICNFVRVAAEVYGYTDADRVYQGMTIAFDFSVEELWVPLAVGATLVPAPLDTQLVGDDLHEFLEQNGVTALCCVPTLLATVEEDLPDLRFLLVSGEACPPDLIERWLTPGRRVLNAYGPTETTVTATWKVLGAGQSVTIGGPLPTYSVVVIGSAEQQALGLGEVGEICIGGVGLSDGYLNGPERTSEAFIDDFIELEANPSGRIYRTGDMGRINDDLEVEYLGRIDTQVKIRGYRIELNEIEAVARKVDGVGQVVVQPWSRARDNVELVAYVIAAESQPLDIASLDAALRSELPAYMVPSYYEQLDAFPLLPSTKVDRKALPEPSGQRFSDSGRPYVAPRNEKEAALADLLAEVLDSEPVSIDADFFDHLGANSLTMANYVTDIRKTLGIKRVSMKQLYQNPTIAELAALIESKAAAAEKPKKRSTTTKKRSTASETLGLTAQELEPTEQPERPDQDQEPELVPALLPTAPRYEVEPRVATTAAYLACGAAQLLIMIGAAFFTALLVVATVAWIDGAAAPVGTYLRAAVAGLAVFFAYSGWLIGLKWLAVGRFTTDPIPLWSVAYLRFWIARTAILANPLNLLRGTPLYWAFLRLLGARVGPGAVVFSAAPVCADLATIGARTVIRSDVIMPGYTAHNGYIFPGTIDIGTDTLICEAVTIDIDTRIGDNIELGTASAVLSGQDLQANCCYHGSPAEPTSILFDHVQPRALPRWHRVRYAVLQIVVLFAWSTPFPFVVATIAAEIDWWGLAPTPFGGFVGELFALGVIAGALYAFWVSWALAMVVTMPRLYNRYFVPEQAHRIWGIQHWLARRITRSSNSRLLNVIFGDSSMILHYLSAIGYDLSESTQTGSNFGVDQRHHSPFLCRFKRNTMVSDGLRMLNMEISTTSFLMRQITMPPDTYLGNNVFYPADSSLGPNCLIATKAAVPIDGPALADVGILGSPAFEIPRSVARDQKFDHYKQPGVIEGRLRAKLRSNLQTLGLYLLRNYVILVLTLLFGVGSARLFDATADSPIWQITAAVTLTAGLVLLSGAAISIYLERLMAGFGRLPPLFCSLYDPRFWLHERFWKFNDNPFVRIFNATPMKGPVLRAQGAIVGKRLFDDGVAISEPPLVEIGDDCMLNLRSVAQSHSLEDGTFKSDNIIIGNSCTVGTSGFVHYGAIMQDSSVLEADAFLMKGSVVETDSIWRGNPARDAATADVGQQAATLGGTAQ